MARRLTVLQVIPSLDTGGAERGCVDVAKALVAGGHRALVASSGGRMVAELEAAGAEHLTRPMATKNPLGILLNILRLVRILRREKVDILHARSRAPGWSAFFAARLTGTPFVTTYHAPYSGRNDFKIGYNAVMALGDRVIAISRFIERHVREIHSTPPEKLRLIHRGIDLAAFTPSAEVSARAAALAATWQMQPDVPVIVLPGRLTRWKGQSVFIQALSQLRHLPWQALIVGSDQGRSHYSAELQEQIRRLNLAERIRLTGDCRDMPACFALADIAVSPATQPEAFGRVIVEAQAMGLPTIISDHGAADETIVPGKTGWAVPPNDPLALAAALAQALRLTPEQRLAFATAARAHVAGRFTVERMCADTLSVYAELAP